MNPKALAHLQGLSPFQQAAAHSSPILMGLAADLRGGSGNASSAYAQMQKQQEAAARKESIGGLMGQMGIAGPQRALLDAMPPEAAIQMMAQQAFAPAPPPVERKTMKDVNGRPRYVDTGELVFNDVEKAPESTWKVMTPEEVAQVPNLDPSKAYLIHPENGIKAVGGGGVEVNNTPAPEKGFRWVYNEAGQPSHMEPIPGGSAEIAAMEAQREQIDGKLATAETAGQMIATIDSILDDPALETSTGLLSWMQYLPGTDAYRFGTKAQQLQGQAFLKAYDSLKGAGQITEIEGRKAEQAIGRLSTAQKPEDYKAALTELRGILSEAEARATQQAGATAGVLPGANVPDGYDPEAWTNDFGGEGGLELWNSMTPENRRLWLLDGN